MLRLLFAFSLALLMLALQGCSAPGPKGWPKDIDGRSLRDGGSVWVYAKSSSGLDSVRPTIDALAPQASSAKPAEKLAPRGIVIVTEPGEKPPGLSSISSNAGELVKQAIAQIGDQRVSDKLRQSADALAMLIPSGAWGRTLGGATGVPDILRDQAPFIVAVPSSRAIESAFDGAVDAVIDQMATSGTPLTQRLLMRPLLNMGKSEFVIAVREARKQALAEALRQGRAVE